ncbi:MAG: BlaI/MecI/CopY family transcriptional regulator [Muribaculaceae bacterium]|nr:BlaI/MecI/CopY family transcriptional regulator [Muribaculaceae bacterium]MDE6702319.1 BlaI/MecI/CopY family transcriptional regulator [Muribaculaceae bacterium]
MKKLTEREEELMTILWNNGPLFVREIIDFMPEPKPHFNTVSTFVRLLESKGFVTHSKFGGSYRYEAALSRDDFSRSTLQDVVDRYFGSSIKASVSALVDNEKLSDDEIRELVEMVIRQRNENKKQ